MTDKTPDDSPTHPPHAPNGVPKEAGEETPKGVPDSGRSESETAGHEP